jgi:hypothetical protein
LLVLLFSCPIFTFLLALHKASNIATPLLMGQDSRMSWNSSEKKFKKHPRRARSWLLKRVLKTEQAFHKSKKAVCFDTKRAEWCTYLNIQEMYKEVYTELVASGLALKH